MSQTKVQLIAPIGVVTASTLETTGVLTATTFVGDIAGTVTGITSTTDNLNLGIITATSFAGDFTGIGSGLTGTPNIVAGIVTATKFVGNTPGTVSGIACVGGLKTDGTAWVWGGNDTGELGQNNNVKYSSPVQIPGTNWSTMSGGTSNVLVLSSYNP